jgi:hypothetical protein
MKIAVTTTRNFNYKSVMKELSASNMCCWPPKKMVKKLTLIILDMCTQGFSQLWLSRTSYRTPSPWQPVFPQFFGIRTWNLARTGVWNGCRISTISLSKQMGFGP